MKPQKLFVIGLLVALAVFATSCGNNAKPQTATIVMATQTPTPTAIIAVTTPTPTPTTKATSVVSLETRNARVAESLTEIAKWDTATPKTAGSPATQPPPAPTVTPWPTKTRGLPAGFPTETPVVKPTLAYPCVKPITVVTPNPAGTRPSSTEELRGKGEKVVSQKTTFSAGGMMFVIDPKAFTVTAWEPTGFRVGYSDNNECQGARWLALYDDVRVKTPVLVSIMNIVGELHITWEIKPDAPTPIPQAPPFDPSRCSLPLSVTNTVGVPGSFTAWDCGTVGEWGQWITPAGEQVIGPLPLPLVWEKKGFCIIGNPPRTSEACK